MKMNKQHKSFKKSLYFFLASLIFFSSFIRYLPIPLQRGDSWVTYYSSVEILKFGAIPWILSPLSYMGWFPFSMPSGLMVLIAVLSTITDLSVDSIAYIFSHFLGVFSLFAMFLLVRVFTRSNLVLIFSLVNLSTFHYFVSGTYENISARGFFVTMTLFVTFILLKNFRGGFLSKYTLLSPISLLILISIHRSVLLYFLTFLLPLFLFRISLAVGLSQKIFSTHSRNHKKINQSMILVLVGSILLINISGIISFEDYGIAESPRATNFSEDNAIGKFLNVARSYGEMYGANIVILVLGFLNITNFKSSKDNNLFLVIITIFSSIFILNIKYFMNFFIPFAAIISAFGILFIKKIVTENRKGPLFSIILFIIVTFSQILFYFYQQSQYANLIIGFLAMLLLFYCITILLFRSASDINHKSILNNIVVSLILVSSILCVSLNYNNSLDKYDEFKNYSSESRLEFEHPNPETLANDRLYYNRAFWVREYVQPHFLSEARCFDFELCADDTREHDRIWALSGVPSVESTLDFAINEEHRNLYDTTNLNLSFLDLAQRRSLYDSESLSFLGPEAIAYRVLVENNDQFIDKYSISWFILENMRKNSTDMYVKINDSHYIIFQDDYHSAFFNKNYL